MIGKLDPEERVMGEFKTEMRGYYSVFNPRGEKIADCGSMRDAINLVGMRNCRWDGHYYQFNPLPGDIVDINQLKELKPYIPVSSIADDIAFDVVDNGTIQLEPGTGGAIDFNT